MYLVVEALADGGVKMGLPRPLAMKLASQTMMVILILSYTTLSCRPSFIKYKSNVKSVLVKTELKYEFVNFFL